MSKLKSNKVVRQLAQNAFDLIVNITVPTCSDTPNNIDNEPSVPSSFTIEDLPDELLVEVFSYLPDEDLVNCALYVSTRWHDVCNTVRLWKGRKFEITDREKVHEALELAGKMPQLRSLYLEDLHTFCVAIRGTMLKVYWQLTDEMFESIAEKVNISFICIINDWSLSRTAARSLASMNNLSELVLMKCSGVHPTILSEALEYGYLPHLQRLHIARTTELGDEVVRAACLGCPILEHLRLDGLPYLTEKGLHLLEVSPQLRRLSLSDLKRLRALGTVKGCMSLRELDLWRCPGLGAVELQPLLQLTQLRSLFLGMCDVSGLQLSDVASGMPSLRLLAVEYCRGVDLRQLDRLRAAAPHLLIEHSSYM